MNTTTLIGKATNSIYGQDMVLLKTYIYEKKLENGYVKYLTLFSLLPAKEYRQDVTVYKNKAGESLTTGTNGVYVKTIGSQTDLIQTTNRVSLNFYQKHLEANGWQFTKTVSGTFGMDLEVARQLAWHEIRKLRKGGEKVSPMIKAEMLKTLDDLEYAHAEKGYIAPYLKVIRDLITNL